ncbi:MAG: hypothetical protein H7Y28_03200 [Rhodoferax sp.]|nr:hypothetical protein [Rhodoferax sp.]
MNAWSAVLQKARRSLIMLAVVVVLCGASVYGLGLLATNLQQHLASQQSSLQEQQALLERYQNDLSNVRTHIKAYEKLREQGLVGEADRAQWVEQLQASHMRLGLPGSISVQLQAAKPLANTDAPADPPADPASAIVPMSHDLQFEIREVHEGELLALLQDFRANVRARFRVESCQLRDPTDSGLTATCTLRFVTIPATIAAQSPTPATAGAP